MVFSDIAYETAVQHHNLARMAKFWDAHQKGKFSLTPAQQDDFAARCSRAKLGLPAKPASITPRRRMVELVPAE